MHNEYTVSSIAECYETIIQWVSSTDAYSSVFYDDFIANTLVNNQTKTYKYKTVSNYGMSFSEWSTLPSTVVLLHPHTQRVTVFKNNRYGFFVYVVLFDSTICITVSDTFSTTSAWYEQLNTPRLSHNFANITDLTNASRNATTLGDVFTYNNAQYTVIATLKVESENTRLYCHYKNNCIALNTVDETAPSRKTYNAFFGMIRKHKPWDRGWYVSGSAFGVLEVIDRVNVERAKNVAIVDGAEVTTLYAKLTYVGTDLSLINDPEFNDFDYHIRQYYTPPGFDSKLYVYNPEIDTEYKLYNKHMPRLTYNNNYDIVVRTYIDNAEARLMHYTSNLNSDLFTKCYLSLSTDDIELPTYKNIISKSVVDQGRSVNTLNGISLVMPIYIMAKRDPSALTKYSSIGTTEFISYVNMLHLSSGSIHPIEFSLTNVLGDYQSFALYRRRMDNHNLNIEPNRTQRLGFNGYNGLAVRQFEEEQQLIDWGYLYLKNKQLTVKSIWNKNTGIHAYKGDITFKKELPKGTIKLVNDYTYYDKLKIEYTDSEGLNRFTFVWTVSELKAKFDANTTFDLLNGEYPGNYIKITPVNDTYDARTHWIISDATCGIINIYGY